MFTKITLDEEFFYKTWKKTFHLYYYKKEVILKKFVDIENNLIALKEMKQIIQNLVSESVYSITDDDPEELEKLLKDEIDRYEDNNKPKERKKNKSN